MAYGLWMSLDQTRWYRNNFSATNPLTGTIYTDINQTTAKNLTGYAITVRLSKTTGPGRFSDFLNKAATIVVAANGTWSLALTSGDTPQRGLYYVTCELTKSGDQESTLNRVELFMLQGPAV